MTSTANDGAAPPRADAAANATSAIRNVSLAPDDVADAAAQQQQAAERQGVGGDDPLPLAVVEAEVGLRGRQRDVHDGGVEHDHQLGDRHDDEHEPAVVATAPRVGAFGRSRALVGHSCCLLTEGSCGSW